MSFTSTPCIRKRTMVPNLSIENTDHKKRRFLTKMNKNQVKNNTNKINPKNGLDKTKKQNTKWESESESESDAIFEKEKIRAKKLQSKLGTLNSEFEELQTKVEVTQDENLRLNEELAQLRLILEQNGHSYEEIYGGKFQTDSALFVTMNRKAKPQKQILEIPPNMSLDFLENKLQSEELDSDLNENSEIESELEYELDENYQIGDEKQAQPQEHGHTQEQPQQGQSNTQSSELEFFEIKRFQAETGKRKTSIITNL
ncbi:hypothetical protein M0812_07387 [Anaeramoeba flamelloides]|uniref:Uncharacterized protein n=1 Tax=Anaeramoeba flamelloides TaxID=1746091 RepID=A0AAV8A355_9EUKA|nr:hypothetical protein M0812_07387 [Anaeramoeba flamelloides]